MTNLRKAARGPDKVCVRCKRVTGDVCGRHYNGIRQHWFGKGRGTKENDLAMAQLCNDCDGWLTEGSGGPKMDTEARLIRSEEFLFLCFLTLLERQKEGLL